MKILTFNAILYKFYTFVEICFDLVPSRPTTCLQLTIFLPLILDFGGHLFGRVGDIASERKMNVVVSSESVAKVRASSRRYRTNSDKRKTVKQYILSLM